MRIIYLCVFTLIIYEASAAAVRKQPEYAKPVYSDSYVPAAMQVIFYAVEQIKTFPPPEEPSSSTSVPTTMAHAPGQHQPAATTAKPTIIPLMQTTEDSQAAVVAEASETPAAPSTTITSEEHVQEQTISESSTSALLATSATPEISNETPEMIYGTPETNHETPEASQELPEINQEISTVNNEGAVEDVATGGIERTTVQMTPIETSTKADKDYSDESSSSSSEESKEDKDKEGDADKDKKKEAQPTIDSVVQEIYGIVKKNKGSSEESSGSSEERKKEKGKARKEDGVEEEEDEDEEGDEIRFSQLGEKVFQVPRPSLLTYLKRARITLRCSLEQLAVLYDALSKDARRQGFVKFSGYSDRVLKTLETSAEGGMGPQLQLILEKIVQRNEVTRDDTKARVAEAIKDLKQPGSQLNRELRRLLPLNFKL